MQLWILANEFAPDIIGGLGIVASNLSARFAHDGHNVTVFTSGKQETMSTMYTNGLTLIHVPKIEPYYSKQKRKYYHDPLLNWCSHNKVNTPQLVHIHSVPFTNVALFVQRSFHIPLVYTCHSLIINEPPSQKRDLVLERQIRLLKHADVIVVPSDWQMQELEFNYSFCRGKIRIIPNGVQSTKANLLETQGHVRLLFVGRIIPQKGIEELLQAMALLTPLSKQEITLEIVGAGSTTYIGYLKEMADRLNISSHVKWLGYRPPHELQAMYREYSGVVVPSHQESFGLVSLESLANGVPLISTQAGGLANYVTSDVAFVIPRVHPSVIAQCILSALQDPEERARRVRQGKRLAANYSWEIISVRYTKLFNELYLR